VILKVFVIHRHSNLRMQLRSLWVLGKVCDELSYRPQPHLANTHDLLQIIRRQISDAEQLSNEVTLESGKATIPLSGIDIPFHSTMLRGEIEHYRDYLSSKVHVADIKPNELVGRWIPNVVGKPFSLDRSYIELVQHITGSGPLQRLLRVMDG
jgi:fatty acid synthase subunit beta